MMKSRVEITTYTSYERAIIHKLVPYTHLDFSSKVSSANAIVRIFPEETKV